MMNISDEIKKGSEDQEIVLHVATKIIEPTLQKALGEAREQASPQEVISALANCYGGLLVDDGEKGRSYLFAKSRRTYSFA